MKHILGGLLALACVATPWSAAGAREAPGDLQSCVVTATGPGDRRTLVQWMFSAIALHPDLEDLARVSDARREQANRAMGELMVRLLTVDCADQARQAFRDGSADAAIGEAFGRIGQMAGEGLFAEPRVAAEAQGLIRHVDMNRLVELFLP
ncbi:MAG: hypothetical protein GXY30_00075 [Xanthomonadaceae bacterium]|jgi:hypothetical protein|nr:hypothetical protein [Xanthomonadaceae bacterium]